MMHYEAETMPPAACRHECLTFGCEPCRDRALLLESLWRCACGDWRDASVRRWCPVCRRRADKRVLRNAARRQAVSR